MLISVPEPPAVVAGLDDIAVLGEPIQQGCGYLGVAEYIGLPLFRTGSSLRIRTNRALRFGNDSKVKMRAITLNDTTPDSVWGYS